MTVLESCSTKDGLLSVVQHENMLALRNGDTGYSCIYTDDNIYQPVYLLVQQIIESFAEYHSFNHASILGGGCCTIPRFIIKRFGNNIHIDSVEYLPSVVELTRKYFLQGIKTDHLNLITEDAFQFISNSSKKYDFIFVDLFVRSIWPEECKGKRFLTNLSMKTTDYAVIVFNCYHLSNEQCSDFCQIAESIIGKSHIIKDDYGSYYVLFLKRNCNEQCVKKYLL